MKDGLRFVDSDMHIQEPGDLLKKYLDPEFKKRVTWAVDGKGKISRRTWTIDGLPTGADSEMQAAPQEGRFVQGHGAGHRGLPPGCCRPPGSRTRAAWTSPIERGYDEEAQVMGMEMEGIDIAVLFPTGGLGLLARDNMDPRLSLALSQAYNNWIHDFCQYSPERMKFAAMLPLHDVNLACHELKRAVEELGAVASFIRPNLVDGHFWHSNYWDPLYSLHEELNVSWCFHEGTGAWNSHMNELYGENRFYRHVASHWIEMQQALIAMVIGGVFEFHPKLRVGLPGSAKLLGARHPDAHRVGLRQLSRVPRALPVADAQGILSAQLLGRGGRQRARDRRHRGTHRRKPDVHLHRLSALSTRTSPTSPPTCSTTCPGKPPRPSSWAAPGSTTSTRKTSRKPTRPRRRARSGKPRSMRGERRQPT